MLHQNQRLHWDVTQQTSGKGRLCHFTIYLFFLFFFSHTDISTSSSSAEPNKGLPVLASGKLSYVAPSTLGPVLSFNTEPSAVQFQSAALRPLNSPSVSPFMWPCQLTLELPAALKYLQPPPGRRTGTLSDKRQRNFCVILLRHRNVGFRSNLDTFIWFTLLKAMMRVEQDLTNQCGCVCWVWDNKGLPSKTWHYFAPSSSLSFSLAGWGCGHGNSLERRPWFCWASWRWQCL